MYTIIHLLLAQIQVLNNQIKDLLLFIAKNIPLRSKPFGWNSPKYNKLKIDKLPNQANPHKFKLHYIYREFTTDFFKIDLSSLPKNGSSLAFRKFSPHIMGLCLTYLVNCGLSTRKTRDIMREVHGVRISHTQIANYATTAAYCVKPFVDSYDYNPTNYLAADETYTKVKGSKRYIWFIMDAIKKSILGYRSSVSRDVVLVFLLCVWLLINLKSFPVKL